MKSATDNAEDLIKTLTRQTVADNARFFEGDETRVPRHCITMGIGTIMDARSILLLATGERKAAAVAAMVEGAVSAMCPASILQMHERVTVLIDEPAAAKLKNREYYERAARENRALKERFGEFYADG